MLWLVAEDLSAVELGSYGNAAAQTPNLDNLANDGLRFTKAFSITPVCAPSRSSFITGLHNTTINAHNHRSHVGIKSPHQTGYVLPEPVRLLPALFQDAGYTTAIWGKMDYNFNWQEGYDFQFEIDSQLIGWDEVTKQQPFFAQVQFEETHRDWRDQPRVTDRNRIEIPSIYPESPQVREAWGDYLDELATMDRKIGAVVERLEEDGLADNTIVIFFSDHGREMPRGKQWVYEGGIHVPLIVHMPNQLQHGMTNGELISLVDVSATSLALAGLDVPAYFDGRPFMGDAINPRDHVIATRDRDDETFDRVRAVRTHQHKYIRNYHPELPWTQYNQYIEHLVDGQTNYETFGIMRELHAGGKLTPQQAVFWALSKPREELYDVINDPWETNNLAGDPAMQSVLEDLRAKLDRWIEEPHPMLSWRDKGAVPEDGARLFVMSQNDSDPSLVDIVTTVDDERGEACSLKIEYSLDNGNSWHRAVLTDQTAADYGDVEVDNDSDHQLLDIQTVAAGANTVRFQWSTRSPDNGSGTLGNSHYPNVRIRVTQSSGGKEREPVVSTRGFVRDFPAVIVDDSRLKLRFD